MSPNQNIVGTGNPKTRPRHLSFILRLEQTRIGWEASQPAGRSQTNLDETQGMAVALSGALVHLQF